MIRVKDQTFILETLRVTYAFKVSAKGHLEHLYYGPKVYDNDLDVLARKRISQVGTTVAYDQQDLTYTLDQIPLEFSTHGKGDYRSSPFILQMPDGSFTSDFIYQEHHLDAHELILEDLPYAKANSAQAMTLSVVLQDTLFNVQVVLNYTVFEDSDAILRNLEIINHEPSSLELTRCMSMMLDLENRDFKLLRLAGGWIKESHAYTHDLAIGVTSHGSTTGNSSNRANPAFLLAESSATQENGWVYGCNLIFSGNHLSAVELDSFNQVRLSAGLSDQNFKVAIKQHESLVTPQAVLIFSDQGLGGFSRASHHFINHHIIPSNFQFKPRPVIYNNWEATFFKFNEGKLLALAKKAKHLGCELFVLDDGWFAGRDADNAGLGDYRIHARKFPQGLHHFGDKLKQIGLDFGLWVEPEMVNEDSDLFRLHPDYVMQVPGRKASLGRNQYVLDLSQSRVVDYISDSLNRLLDNYPIRFIKWDMNRHQSDVFHTDIARQGRFNLDYMIGLYRILKRVFETHPQVLLESCASGGNRFDLGMLCYSPQIWASDDTDPIERLKIQDGLLVFYPPSTISNHVSSSPHQQTLRKTSLSTRFNVAAFGVLGYELDLNLLNHEEVKEIKAQIDYYKAHRQTLQFGEFQKVIPFKSNQMIWQIRSGKETVLGYYQMQMNASDSDDYLRGHGFLRDHRYQVTSKPQRLMIADFGELIKHVLPVHLNPHGWVIAAANKYYSLSDAQESFEVSGGALNGGIGLNQQFIGSYYNNQVRLWGDFGSTLYSVDDKGVIT